MNSFIRKYLLPGLIFQSVIVGGGYGTGREIAEFFLSHGALGGLLGLGVAMLSWSIILALAFEFARITGSYDYRAFFKALLGPLWPLFEVAYLLIALLVLSVLGAAAGEMLAAAFGLPLAAGAMTLLAAVGALAWLGGKAIARVLAWWSLLLYAVYALFFLWTARQFGGDIASALAKADIVGGWHIDGVRYAAYNLVALSAVLFVLPGLETRRQALASGALAGFLGIAPAVMVFLAMLARYPGIESEPVPVLAMMHALNALWFVALFQVVLFGTFIETGVGIVHAVNQRVAATLEEKGRRFPQWARFVIAAGLLAIAIFLARAVGIIDLIAKGYGALSYAFIAIVVAPLLTVGVLKIAATRADRMEKAYARD